MQQNSDFLNLSRFAERLLDLTRRNPLINSNWNRSSSRQFRIVDEIPDELANRLPRTTMRFKALPPQGNFSDQNIIDSVEFREKLEEAKQEDQEYLEEIRKLEELGDDDLGQGHLDAENKLVTRILGDLKVNPNALKSVSLDQHARDNGINPDWNLPDPKMNVTVSSRHSDRYIQTLMLPDTLASVLRRIYSDYNSSLRERGVNPLYFCFGFLRWKESPSSDTTVDSPLLMLHVEVSDHDNIAELAVQGVEDQVVLNMSLREKLINDFGITLPELKDGMTVEEYFDLVRDSICSKQTDWEIKRWISFGIYQSSNIPMVHDLLEIQHNPSGLLRELLTGSNVMDVEPAQIYDVDDKKFQKILPCTVEPADASQRSAIIDVLQGKNLVIQGPPGTGKSQTISNIIASLMRSNKKVLFIAQKQAALDVVKNRLQSVGLGDFVLELFSNKGTKKQVLQAIKTRMDTNYTDGIPNQYDTNLNDYQDTKERLNSYANKMNSEYAQTGISLHDVIWDKPDLSYVSWSPESINRLGESQIGNIASMTEAALVQNMQSMETAIVEYQSIFGNNNQPLLAGNTPQSFISHAEIQRLKGEISGIQHELRSMLDVETRLYGKNPLLENINYIDWCDRIRDQYVVKRWLQLQNPDLDPSVMIKYGALYRLWVNAEGTQQLKKLINLISRQKKATQLEALFNYPTQLYSDDQIRSAIIQLKNTTLLSKFTFEWKQSRTLFLDLWNGTPKRSLKLPSKDWKEAGQLLGNFFENVKKPEQGIDSYESIEKEIIGLGIEANALGLIRQISEEEITEFIVNADNVGSEERAVVFHDSNLISEFDELAQKADGVIKLLESKLSLLFEKPDSVVSKFGRQLSGYIKVVDEIQNWDFSKDLNWSNVENALLTGETKDFFYKYIAESLPNEDIGKVYKVLVRSHQYAHIEATENDTLVEFNAYELSNLQRRMKQMEQDSLQLARLETITQISKQAKNAPEGQRGQRVADFTETRLLQRTIGVANPRISVRELFSRAGESILSYMPCTLMSPLSVAEILPLKDLYDVVIIDEASQMPPEYAIGGIARAKQAVIVGDLKQLPPTTFFTVGSSDDERDVDELESILELGTTAFHPTRALLWHYRSNHEDLIRFSNAEFYKNLIIPSTAHPEEQGRGIEYHYVDDGIYHTGGINHKEARAMVEQTIMLMESRPNESIGLATMNVKQKEYIEGEFALLSEGNPKVRSYIKYWEEKDEGLNEFFIKNLENVQGDERDIIIIGTLYGKNENGQLFRRFGPINGANGWRRLNVLFTRAKNQIHLFTSMSASDLASGTGTTNYGQEVLAKYLRFANTGELQSGSVTGRDVESPFQQWAINVIEQLPGFKCDWEVGVKGYRIDIAVKHSDYPGPWIMAIETDGATYHSTKSARDRDIQRQEILESYGWYFYRVWSTDWLRDPIGTANNLKQAVMNRLSQLTGSKASVDPANGFNDGTAINFYVKDQYSMLTNSVDGEERSSPEPIAQEPESTNESSMPQELIQEPQSDAQSSSKLEEADTHFDHGEYEKAFSLYEEILDWKELDPEICYRLAFCAYELEMVEEGLKYIDAALLKDPENSLYHLEKAPLHAMTQDYVTALRSVEKSLSISECFMGYRLKGLYNRDLAHIIWEKEEKKPYLEDSMRAFQKAIERVSADSPGALQLADTYWRLSEVQRTLGLFDDAIDSLSTFIDMDKGMEHDGNADGWSRFWRAWIYYEQGLANYAIADLTIAIGLNPNEGLFHAEMGICKWTLKSYLEACEHYLTNFLINKNNDIKNDGLVEDLKNRFEDLKTEIGQTDFETLRNNVFKLICESGLSKDEIDDLWHDLFGD